MAYERNNGDPANSMPTWTCPPPNQILTHLAAAGSTLVKNGSGAISSINSNDNAAGTLSIYDGLSAAGTLLGVIDTGARGFIPCPWKFSTGLFVVKSTGDDITISSV